MSLKKRLSFQIINIASEKSYSTEEIIIILKKIFNVEFDVNYVPAKNIEIKTTRGSTGKAKKILGFSAKIDIEEGLYEGWDSQGRHFTLSWDKENKKRLVHLSEGLDIDTFKKTVEKHILMYANSKHRRGFYEADGQRLRDVITTLRNKQERMG